ncbi:hypothetical protein [Nostoc sp. FACHB-110]|nr:hypothetical protein [Nostoc sp. FACHB-110]
MLTVIFTKVAIAADIVDKVATAALAQFELATAKPDQSLTDLN